MAQPFIITAISHTLIAASIVAAVLSAVWTFDDLPARFRETLEDDDDQGADWGCENRFHGSAE